MVVNCSIDVSIEDITGNDFFKTTILSTSRGIGDGQTNATAVVLLKNADGSVIPNYRPSFEFVDNSGSSVQGSAITFSECSVSNEQGISVCIIRSISVGSLTLSFNNVKVELFGQVYFDPPSRDGTFFQVVNSGQIDQNAGGYSVTSYTGSPFSLPSSSGAPYSGMMQKVNGYTIFTNTTGGMTPVE